ncbi:MAG: pyroglutamyl-peptidase I [Planctomycetales bacterium]|nr:pyroglutamyl-peptidase I [Planctomycetales bacterium]
MNRVLLTAFEPYGPWQTNASWLTLVEMTRELPAQPAITTRLYPVDFDAVLDRLSTDLVGDYDYVILTGQAPGRTRLELETVSLNLATVTGDRDEVPRPLIVEGPLAYASDLPAESTCQLLRQAGIPAATSRHAGTYLCNAALYYALHLITARNLRTRAMFVHLPLDPAQAALQAEPIPSQSIELSAKALRLILQSLPTA